MKLTILAGLLMVSNAFACGGSAYNWLDIYVSADGNVSRHIKPDLTPDHKEINDTYYLRNVDESVSLIAGMYLEGDAHSANIQLLEQVSDSYTRDGQTQKGVFASLYKVTKITKAAPPSQVRTEESEYVKVTNNYMGNGTYTRGCGDTQVESDRSKIVMPIKP